MSEGGWIGWEWSDDDIEKEFHNKPLSELEKMLIYHDMDLEAYSQESNNSKRHLMWNFRKFGKDPSTHS